MIRFECDYAEGAHSRIMKRMMETNEEQTPGYGVDEHCERARQFILKECGNPQAEVHFLVGGTQANLTVISSILRPHQGAVCAVSGHINVHETGAIEATGHKVLPLASADGKITPEQIEELYQAHWNDDNHEHVVQPGMVYISHPTENGTTYTKAELTAIKAVCKEHGLPLYLDGARLGYALGMEDNDITLADLTQLCDIYYIGGTKVGALFGEAVVISNPALQQDFRYLMKQKGGMLAKGRLLGIQYETLFEDGLYVEIGRHAVKMAMRIQEAFKAKGCSLLYDSRSNQQFPILTNDMIAVLEKKYSFQFWEKVDENRSAVRFCTSWATKEESVDELVKDIQAL